MVFPRQSSKIKVMIVDDSFFMRRVIESVLRVQPELEVVGQAPDGVTAIGLAVSLRPDVIVMDYHMPVLNGAQTIEKIMASIPDHPPAIVMLSAYTNDGAEETFECLRAGAVDYVTKPSGELSVSIKEIEQKLVSSIITAGQARVQRPAGLPAPSLTPKIIGRQTPKKIIIIGSSTGGPVVVEQILASLPANLPAAVIIVQHMPEFFVSRFVRRLDRRSPLDLKEAAGKETLLSGQALMVPGDKNLELSVSPTGSVTVEIMPVPTSQALSPSIDRTMSSAAALGKKAIGVILTGMGQDGVEGMAAIKKAGGYTIIQELNSAVVDSMPRAVLDRRLADEILTPENIASRLVQLCS